MQIKDGDHNLVDGGAWFTLGNISVRLHRDEQGVVSSAMFAKGHESEPPLAACHASIADAKDVIASVMKNTGAIRH